MYILAVPGVAVSVLHQSQFSGLRLRLDDTSKIAIQKDTQTRSSMYTIIMNKDINKDPFIQF